MKSAILNNLNNPRELEKLYRADKTNFKQTFMALHPEVLHSPLADYWTERFAYENDDVDWGGRKDWYLLIILGLIAGLTAKLPAVLSINEDFFYPRNVGFVLFPALTAFFAYKNKLPVKQIAFIAAGGLLALAFINLLPANEESDTLVLACFHLLIYLWLLLGLAFVGGSSAGPIPRLRYLKYSGDLLVITGLFVIAGGVLSAFTIGLFSLLGLDIEEFYFSNVVAVGLPAAPILGTYLIQTNPNLIGKITPTIARIFSPLVLVMLVVYLVAIGYSGKDPYNDREFLLFFNALSVGVMAIIFYSIAGFSHARSKLEIWLLFLLSLVTILVNGIALSAILFRISEWGFTANRTAVLGGNILILIHLLVVTKPLFQTLFRQGNLSKVGESIAVYLPVYLVWAIIVIFLFPFLFGFS